MIDRRAVLRELLPPATGGFVRRSGASVRRSVLALRRGLRALGPVARRTVDVIVVSAALLLVAPVMLLAGLAMKVSSPGPMFFAQERIGRNGVPFRMFKLRTMIHGADAQKTLLERMRSESLSGVRFKLRRDPRVTRVGRMLRKLSIDELPQLWNVLRGDMTLVGPRPPVWREVRLYDPRAMRRLEVLPGLTCLWQVRGRSDLSFEQQVELDIEYIDRVGVLEEVRILLATVPAVITGRGAY